MSEHFSWIHKDHGITIDCTPGRVPRVSELMVEGRTLALGAPVPLVEVVTVKAGHAPASARLTHTTAGASGVFAGSRIDTSGARESLILDVDLPAAGLRAEVGIDATHPIAAYRFHVTLRNTSSEPVTVRSVATVALAFVTEHGSIADWTRLHGVSEWAAEGRWSENAVRSADLPTPGRHQPPRGAAIQTSTGTWSTSGHLPVGALESRSEGVSIAWQIEHNGPWRAEVGENPPGGYLALSGPTDGDSSWTRVLQPSEEFTTVPATIALGPDRTAAIAELTRFRRVSRRAHADNLAMPVVFNDYMNTLMGDPTTERLLPLIAAAADVGAEIFCIDAGWYDDGGDWWDSVGEWTPSTVRFPGGLDEVLDSIRSAGMIPGLWVEPEVVGVRSPAAATLPDEAFLSRHGQRIVEHDRYHLDLRHHAARAHLDAVIDRIVDGLGVGYVKFDYNIDPGPGTDRDADSIGDGLLEHNRAHLAWLDGVLDRHPRLVIEACSSGAMRADPAILQRVAMQSTSDQEDLRLYPPIAASAPMSYLPEQAANWAYPQPGMTEEEATFALVTGMLGRFYVSGHLDRMTPDQRRLVAEAISTARSIRGQIASSTPSWPLGLPGWDDEVVCLVLNGDESDLMNVWHRGASTATLSIPLLHHQGRALAVDVLFPRDAPAWGMSWDPQAGILTIEGVEALSARTLRLSPR